MGHTRKHAIVVSGYGEDVTEAHGAAVRFFSGDPEHGWNGRIVSPVVPGPSNGERSFLVGPDGSNEGWETSNEGDRRRGEFVDWLRRRSEEPGYEGAFLVDWAEIVFGDDEDRAGVVRHSRDGVYASEE